MLEKYRTILGEGSSETVEKKSRFIATARPVASEDEAKEFIEEMKKKYWNATHNVFAYRISTGDKNSIERFSDDGEPQGTAGKPVLDVLMGEKLINTAVVVTRYFGGTLLGTGGLVRAYGHAAKNGVLSAQIAEMILYDIFSVVTDYNASGKIQYEILNCGYIIQDTEYTDTVKFFVIVEKSRCHEFVLKMTDISNGCAIIKCEKEKYGAIIDETLQLF